MRVRVYRGRADSLDADRAVTGRLFDRVAREREPAVRVWRPGRHVAFGRRDVRSDGYDSAREHAAERGFPAVERRVGGRAVAYTDATVAFLRVTPVSDPRANLHERYASVASDLRAALTDLGVTATAGEPPDSFCPGTHSLRAGTDGGKLAGLAQRVRKRAAGVGGVLLAEDHAAVASVLEPVYDALGVPFDPGSVASVAAAGGDADPATVVSTVESAFVDGEATVESVAAA